VATEAQQLPQNDGNNTDHDNNNDHEEEEEDNSKDYTPVSDFGKEEMCHEAEELKASENEALIPTGRLRDLLNRIDITTPLEFIIKRVLHLGWEEIEQLWRSSMGLI
jgi:hypothetical protein